MRGEGGDEGAVGAKGEVGGGAVVHRKRQMCQRQTAAILRLVIALQEERNRKVLGLLLSKDEGLQELEDQVQLLREQAESARCSAAEALGRLQASEAHVVQVGA